MIETTQEPAENIGTSLKTIIARFTELKENVSGTTESEFEDLDLNRVDKALKSVGVQLKDDTGQFRNLDDVLLELSSIWDSLSRNQQRYIATTAAGSRQQSRFIALMDDYERTSELIDIATDSTGKADQQFSKYADTIEYRLKQIQTKWEELRVSLLDSNVFKTILDEISNILSRVQNIDLKKLLPMTPIAITAAQVFITNFIKTIRAASQNFNSTGQTIGQSVAKGIQKTEGKLVNFLTNGKGTLREQRLNSKRKEIAGKRNKFNEAAETQQTKLEKYFRTDQIDVGRAVLSNINLSKVKGNAVGVVDTFKKAFQDAWGKDKTDEILSKFGVQDINVPADASQADRIRAAQKEVDATREAADTITDLVEQEQKLGRENDEITESEHEITVESDALSTALHNNAASAEVATTAIEGAASAILMTISAMVSGAMSVEEAGDAIVKEMAIVAGQMVFQAMVSGWTVGETFGQHIQAGFEATKVGFIITTIAWAIGLVIKGIGHLMNVWKENHKTIQQQMAEAQASLEEAQSAEQEAKSQAKESKDSVDSIKELKEQFEELSAKQVKTTEEQEKYNELVDQIRTDFPEIVTSYNEITGELIVQNDLWDSIIEKANTLARGDATKAYVASSLAVAAEEKAYDVASQQNEADNLVIEDINKVFKFYGIENVEDFDIEDEKLWNRIVSLIQTLPESEEPNGTTEKELEEFIKSQNFNPNDPSSLKDFIKEVLAGEIVEDNSTYKGDNPDKKKEEWEQTQRANLAIDLSTQKGYSANVSDFVAGIPFFGEKEKNRKEEVSTGLRDVLNEHSIKEWSDVYGITYNGLALEDILANMEITPDNFATRADFKSEGFVDQVATSATALLEEREAKDIELSEAEQNKIDDFYNRKNDFSEQEFNTYVQGLKDYFAGSENATDFNNRIEEIKEDQTEQFNLVQDKIKEQLGVENFDTGNLSYDELNNFSSILQDIIDKYGTVNGAAYGNEILSLKTKYGLSDELFSKILTFDWSVVDFTNFDQVKTEFLDGFEEALTGEETNELWKEFFGIAQNNAAVDLSINTEDMLADLEKQINDSLDSYVSGFEGLSDVIETSLTKGTISYTQSREVEKALEEIGEDAADYMQYNDDGTVFLDVEKLKNAYLDETKIGENLVETAREATEKKREQIQAQLDILKGEASLIKENEKEVNQQNDKVQLYRAQAEILYNMGQLDYKRFEAIKNAADVADEIGNGKEQTISPETEQIIEQLQAELDATDETLASLEKGGEEYENIMGKVRAAAAQMTNSYDEEVKKAQDDYQDALDDLKDKTEAYNEALEEQKEKQEALNDAIKEYNELLYGTKNRESTLDPLYNYQTKLEALEAEVERAKELLESPANVDEAKSALNSYMNNVHQQLVTQKAEQQVYNDYIKAMESDFFGHVESFNDPINGTSFNVNFGDYVTKLSNGMYAINQSLLQQARIPDTIAEEIEKGVSDINTRVQEAKENEDKMREIEKEVQERRDEATRNYAAMETELADALKAAYEEEVNDLKDKYDSMKEADDEYVDALQEAIDKQKKLREKENKWEDLAQKEKKLSLMARDTSGANRKETQSLEKEIQEDRQSLLDEAIDEVIDGLTELYESQSELRESEIELKEALVDNTAYWNQKAEDVAANFTSAEDYMEYMSKLNKEFSDMTLHQQQEKLLEYGETFAKASEEMAFQAIETTSDTGDAVVDIVTVTGEEVQEEFINTSQILVDEIAKSLQRTREAFNQELQSAIDKIGEAQKALNEMAEKIANCAKEMAEAETNAKNAGLHYWNLMADGAKNAENGEHTTDFNNTDSVTVGGSASGEAYRANLSEYQKYYDDAFLAFYNPAARHYKIDFNDKDQKKAFFDVVDKVLGENQDTFLKSGSRLDTFGMKEEDVAEYGKYLAKKFSNKKFVRVADKIIVFDSSDERTEYLKGIGIVGQGSTTYTQTKKPDHISPQNSENKPSYSYDIFAKGGLVDYTGPAWVDGTPTKPEAFLNSSDTQLIGNLMQVLRDIPLLNPTNTISSNSTTYGDTSIEINLNIDKLSSEIDIDNMLNQIKDEIVDVARPVGTNVILQQ